MHMVVSSDNLPQTIKKFKSFTARQILKVLKAKNVKFILDQLAFYKKAHKTKSSYQFWQEGSQPKIIQDKEIMIEKVNYIHQNPVKRGYVNEAKHWRYSSARDYEGIEGLIAIEKYW